MAPATGESERIIRLKKQTVYPEQIEMLLLTYPAVIDCRVLVRKSSQCGLQFLAYIVSNETIPDNKLDQFLIKQLPETILPDIYIPVSNIPLTDSGVVNEEALKALPAVNESLLMRWDSELKKIDEFKQYAVIIQDKKLECEALHLQHLCPKWTATQDIEELDDIDYEEGEGSDNIALSDGGVLNLDDSLPKTLSEAFLSAQKNKNSGIVFINQSDSDVFISYSSLLEQAKKIVTGLGINGLQANDIVILQLTLLEDFVAVFWACLLAGVTPLTVAIAPTYESKNGVLDKLFHAWDLLKRPLIISSEELLSGMDSFQMLYQLKHFKALSILELNSYQPATEWYQSQPSEIAFLQLSSGSTGISKCIPETHQAVIAHIQAATQVNQYHSQHISLNWLPMDHVGPLLMYHVRDVYLGIRQIQVSANLILNDPVLWLDYLERYQVTHTWCANFGYKRVNDCLLDHPHKIWDLSSVKIFCNAGEQVTLPVLRDFIYLTQNFQLNSNALQPAYGMAEAATALTFCNNFELHRHVHHIEKISLNGNLKKVAQEGADTVSFIVQGPPSPGIKIRIVDKKNKLLQERIIGHVQLSGETIMAGYIDNDEANQEAFSDDGWYDTGDLGFLLDGELTITGREKDLIVVYGANYYCVDIEAVVNDIVGVLPTFVAATGLEDESGTEKLAIFFVPIRQDLSRNIKLLEMIKMQVTLLLGISPSFVVPLKQLEFPKTTSGKIQRAKLKNHLLHGDYASVLQEIDCYERNQNTLPNWFFKTTWRLRQAVLIQAGFSEGAYLIFLDEQGLGRSLVKEIRDEHECIVVEAGDEYQQINRHHYRIVANNCEHYHLLFTSLVSHHININQILHLWNYKTSEEITSLTELENTQKWVMCNFLLLIQNIVRHHGYEQSVQLFIITSDAQVLNEKDKICFTRGSLTGLIKTLPHEIPWLQCRHIDLAIADSVSEQKQNTYCLLQEIKTFTHDQEVLYRHDQRYVKRLNLVEFQRSIKKHIPFKEGGIYLISGGLGHIGLAVSQMLLERYSARLIIIGRTDLGDIQSTEHENETIKKRFEATQFLQQFPGDPRYFSVDVCNQARIEDIVQEAEQEWGRELDGVLHLAGCEQQKLLKDETRDSLGQVLRPKVMGSWVLHQILSRRVSHEVKSSVQADSKLFIHFSSVSSHFGAQMSGAEASANAFQNSFSHFQNQQPGINSLCFAWSRWHESVMGQSQRVPLSEDSGYYEMSQFQSILSFLVALQHQQKFLLIGLNGAARHIRHQIEAPGTNTQEITAYFTDQQKQKQSVYQIIKTLIVTDCFQTRSECNLFRLKKMPLNDKGEVDHQQLKGLHVFDGSNTEIFAQASTKTEQQLAWLWQDILAISQPSIHDNFFKLGGNSLQATIFISRIRDIFHYDLSIQTIFKFPSIAKIAEILDTKEAQQQQPIPILSRDPQALPRLSIGQERLWFLYQLAPDDPQYNIPVSVHIHGELDIIALIKSFNHLIQRHEPLRTRFTYRNNQAVQHIAEDMDLSLSITNISGTSEQQQKRLQKMIQKETLKAFDITRLPLIRVKLYRLSDEHYVMFIVMHHIVADGWSMGVFFHELTSLYKAEKSELSIPLLPLEVQYSDFAVWQRDWLSGERLQRQMDYWTRQLADLPVLNLLFDKPRSKNTLNQGQRHTCIITPELNSALLKLSQHQEVSLFMTLMSAFMILCARYTGQDDIAIGTGIANRNRREIEPLIGFFTNTLVMRGDLSGSPDFITVLQRIKKTALDAYDHQDLPFGYLVDALQPQREMGQNPLAQVVFVMQNSPTPVTDIPGITFSPYEVESGLVKMDIEVNVYEVDDGLRIETEFNRNLFDLSSIERMFDHYQIILDAISKNPQQAVSEIPLMTPEEQQRLFVGGSNVDKALSKKISEKHLCIHELVEQVARDNPLSTAVIFEQQRLSYSQLNQKANQLARYLLEQGVKKGSLVGICIERSVEMIIALLAIFKAGAAYVPLDPAYPLSRLNFILDDSALKVILTQGSLKDKLPENKANLICIDSQWQTIEKHSSDDLKLKISGHNLAYIIFTSGSTGNPKGVLIEHRGLCNLAHAQIEIFQVTAVDKVLQFSSLNFDASISEIVITLVSGASLVMVNQSALLFGSPLLRLLQKECISLATIPPSVLATLPVEDDFLPDLKTIIVAGEASNIELIELWSKNRRLINAYGPTETTVCATAYLYNNEKKTPPIGRAIVNTQVYLLDKSGQPVPIGVPGEIHIGGVGVARGYLNRSELTAKQFIPDPFSSDTDARMYCSGDLGRYLPDGNIEYLGRIDQQIKIRGFRVEPGEIENCLREHPVVKEAFIHVNKSDLQNPYLEAFITQNETNTENNNDLRQVLKIWLKQILPPHMVPSSISIIEKIPLTPNGKLDYKQLADLKLSQVDDNVLPEFEKIVSEMADSGDYTKTEAIIIQIISEKLQVSQVGIHSHFFDELGATSLGMVHIHKALEKQLTQKISLIDLFEFPTISQLTQYLTKGSADSAQSQLLQQKMPVRVNKQQTEAIAIIGMSGRFPNAGSVEEFWNKIKDGEELIQKFTKEELLAEGVDKALLDNPKYLRSKGVLNDIDKFDADFFNFTPKEAKITDPQHRLFLESTWEAFEHAGYDPNNYPGTVGIMGGVGSSNTYYQKNLQFSHFGQDVIGDYQLSLNNSSDFLCTRVAYKLNLQGSAATIQSACSTSLVPSVMGYQALINFQADLIVAGGSAITLPAKSGYQYEEGMILSPDGHCRTFDSAAQGTVPGNAVGVVLLKRLEDAVRDGDTIYATIRGAAFNNDGDQKVGFTASGLDGQARVISEALQTANISSESISYVEAHGTATPLGDPIEIRALSKAWYANVEEKKKGYCAVGSVKSNVGHCDAAAGVTGLIKTICALYHKQIPPSLHYSHANPQIDFANSPFYVNTKLRDWKKSATPRRAAVSSFGMGGTNAHVILEEAPEKEASDKGRDWLMFVSSAKTPTALVMMQENLITHLQKHSEQNPADVAYTGQVGRHAYQYRQVIVCRNQPDAIRALSVDSTQTNDQINFKGEVQSEKIPEIVFVFPGQGSQYLHMGRDLYRNESVFREHLDHCAELLLPLLGQDIRELLYTENESYYETYTDRLSQTDMAQPVLFSIEYALAKLLINWGIIPGKLAGHSLGEYTAACVSGVISLEDSLNIVSVRARLMQSMPAGSMLAVPLSEDQIKSYLEPELDLAAINGPNRCVVSGKDEHILSLQSILQTAGIEAKILHTSHAYHSAMMEPMLTEFYEALEDIKFQTPVISLISSTNGKPVQSMDRAYWTSQIRDTVRFSDVLSQIYQTSECIVLEVGPGNTLSSFARSHRDKNPATLIYNTMRHPKESRNDNAYLMSTLGKLWIAGVIPDWAGFYKQEQRYRISIPTYPFERKRYWVEAPDKNEQAMQLNELYKKPDIKDWFYTPSWKRTESVNVDKALAQKKQNWLIFSDDIGISHKLFITLSRQNHSVISVKSGDHFSQHDDYFVIDPNSKKDYLRLIKILAESEQSIDVIAHCWLLGDKIGQFSVQEQFQYYQQEGLYSLIYLLQALEQVQKSQALDLLVLTNQLLNVTGQEYIEPGKATIIGAMKVIPQEYPYIRCVHSDIILSDCDDNRVYELGQHLVAEMAQKQKSQTIAFRHGYRWLEGYESVQIKAVEGKISLLKKHGVYVITGGLGGIGLEIANFLSGSAEAKLVLISRASLPEKQSWEAWLESHDKLNHISKKIRKIQEIESLGGSVLVLSADVTNLEQMQNALKNITQQFGLVNGIIHAAGVPSVELISNLNNKSIISSVEAKIQGMQVLNKVFKIESLDFIFLCSSLSTVLGGVGFAAYCAANAFLDAFAQQKSAYKNIKILSINWEGWSEIGMAVDSDMVAAKKNDLGLLTNEGIEVFKRALNQKIPQIIVSTADLNLRIKQSSQRAAMNITQSEQEISHVRNLETDYRQPENSVEKKIAVIWQKAMGIEQIGLDDDFFELGGDSLTAVQLIPKLRELFKIELSPHSLIHAPTIRALAILINQKQLSQTYTKPVSPLLVQLKGGQADKTPLFLIHPVGGSVYIYRDLANCLKTGQTIYGIQAKGWDGKEQPLKTIDEMALLYTEIIQQIQPHGPYQIGGASLGGVIAFEMAQQFLSAKQAIDLLFMIDTPGVGQMPKDVFKTELDILLYLLNLSTDSSDFMGKIKSLQGDEQLQYFIEEQNKAGQQLFPDIDELRHFLSLFKVNAEALQQYQSQAYSGKILFFVAKEKDKFNAENPQQAWSKIAQGGLDVFEVNGNHISMNQDPNVITIAKQLEIALKEN